MRKQTATTYSIDYTESLFCETQSITDTNPCVCTLVTRASPCRAIEKYVFMCGFVLQNPYSL